VRRSWAVATVGGLLLVVLGISYLFLKITREGISKQEGYAVWALFTDASGLFEKSRVQTAGITVGQIEKRELDPETGKAKITIRMKPDYVLWTNAEVSKKSASLLGEFYLEIHAGSPVGVNRQGERVEMAKLKDGDQIKVVTEPTGMGEIMDQIGTTLPILKEILKDVRTLTSGPISEIATNVNELISDNSAVLERLLGRIDHIAASVEGVTASEAGNVKIAIQNIRDITESIKGVVGATGGEVTATGTAVRDSLQKLQGTVDSLDHTMKNLEKVTGRLEKGEGTMGRLLSDDTIARNVEEITEDAGTFVRGIARLQTIVGLRTEYNYFAGTFKNYVSVQLVPRPDKYYLFEVVDDPRGFREETTTLTESSERGTVSEKTVKISEKLRFSLQFGKRVGPVTGRFGIKESTGGVGLDVHLLGDRLMLSADVFDTRANIYPRVQARAALALYRRNWYVIGGVDDFINSRARAGGGGGLDFFYGTLLTFNDEDLKTLLLFGGGSAGAAAGN